jgi:outer membrane lipoprotein SlyB
MECWSVWTSVAMHACRIPHKALVGACQAASPRPERRRTDVYVRWGWLLVGIGALSACAILPHGPSVMVWPAPGKPFEGFQADEVGCRQYARAQIGVSPEEAATQSAVASATVGTVLGTAAGAVIGAATGNPGAGAAIGAGSGLVLGSASGVQASAASGAALQFRYDRAYLQCMYAKGHQVPGVAAPRVSHIPADLVVRRFRAAPIASRSQDLQVEHPV